MSRTISGTITTAITLGIYDNPVTITQNTFVFPATGGTNAIYAPSGLKFTIGNSGTVSGLTDGIRLFSGGTITNNTVGSISGAASGITTFEGTGAITNFGTIRGGSLFGVSLNLTSAGGVSNQVNAAITGVTAAVYIYGRAAPVYNAGTITGSVKYGVKLKQGGSVTNINTGTISGGLHGITATPAVTVYNAGGISGLAGNGVVARGGRVVNYSTGVIHGAARGVSFLVTDHNDLTKVTISNAGVISGGSDNPASGTARQGVYLNVSGDVAITNSQGGTIKAGRDGVYVHIYAPIRSLSVDNAGLIAGTTLHGMYSYLGGSITNRATGTITGGSEAVSFFNGTGVISNDGVINGGTKGIVLGFGGTVSNTISAARITGGLNGIAAKGEAGVTNFGIITGTSGSGVALSGEGSVSNGPFGTITGGTDGIAIDASAINGFSGVGTVVNTGSIGGAARGIILDSNGVLEGLVASVTNGSGGRIVGGTDGVVINSVASVNNAGTITGNGTTNVGVGLGQHGGSVTNQDTGTITGGGNGVSADGGANVSNAGTITGTALYGVTIAAHGDVTNLSTGSISGNKDGLYISGDANVSNGGTITGVSRYGVRLYAGGSVTNLATGRIAGLN